MRNFFFVLIALSLRTLISAPSLPAQVLPTLHLNADSKNLLFHLKTGLGRDHGILEADQSVETQEFVRKYFFNSDGVISIEKLDELLATLHHERARLVEDLYQSKVLEKVEVDVSSQEKARRSADKIKETPGNAVTLYDEYFIPTIESLNALVKSGQSPELWEGYIHDFIRGYHVFHSPNSHTTWWRENNNIFEVIKGILGRKRIKKSDPNRKEAINLIVEEENIDEIQKCLAAPIEMGHYLSHSELTELKNCQFDLSLINPGLSALWERRTPFEIQEFKNRDTTNDFPAEDATLVFKEVMLTGGYSPKIDVKDQSNGRKYKIKWGVEAHIDNAIGNISYLLGFNIDSMVYRKEVKVHLGKKSYTQFISQLQAKYGQGTANHSILHRGGKPGDEWVILKDVMLEGRPEDDAIKTTPFDPTAVDFKERREFNARLLFSAFLGLADSKISNMKMLLDPSPLQAVSPGMETGLDPRPRILLRMKDLGYALGPSFQVTKLKNIFAIESKYIPELFDEKGIVTLNRKKDKVIIKWNDLISIPGLYDQVTYFDLKWMARKIAALSGDDLEWCLVQAGVPMGPAKIYRSKLIMRRNEIITAFELNEDLDFDYPEETPDLPNLNYPGDQPDGKPEVSHGKIARNHFDGKQIYLKNKSTILYHAINATGSIIDTIINTLSLSPGKISSLTDQLTLNPKASSLHVAGAGPEVELTQAFGADQLGTPMIIKLGVGVNASLSRQVLMTSELHTDRDSKARPYFVRDTLVITVGVGTPLFKKLLPVLPFDLGGSIKVFEAVYEYDHHTEKYLNGFVTSPAPFLKSLVQPIQQAATRLDRMEVIRRSLSFGIEAGARFGLFDYPGLTVAEGDLSFGKLSMDDRAYFRDQFGHLHMLSQKTEKNYTNRVFTLGEVYNPIVFRCPFLGYQKKRTSFKTQQKDFVAQPTEQLEYSNETIIEDNDGRLKEDLIKLRKKNISISDLEYFRPNFQVQSHGKISFLEKIALHKGKTETKQISTTEVTYPDGHSKRLTLHAVQRDKYLGISSDRTICPVPNVAVKNAQRIHLNIEVDQYDPDNSVILVRLVDFFRHGNRQDVQKLIDSLNQRFSMKPDSPFFQDYDLPRADEIDDYRKVYGVVRIHLRLTDLLDQIIALDPAEFKLQAETFLKDQESPSVQCASIDPKFLERMFRRITLKKEVNGIFRRFKKLRAEASKLNRNFVKISELIEKFFLKLQIQSYGTGLLFQIVGEDSIYVSSAIEGIFPSFSVTNDLQERQRRRFSAKHWGKLNAVAPIQYHNRYERVLYSSDLVPIHISQDTMLGRITSGWPMEIQSVHRNR